MGEGSPKKRPPQNVPAKGKRPLGKVYIGVFVALLLAGCVLSFTFGRISSGRQTQAAPDLNAPGARILKSGPWGEIECVPMTITPPESLLPVREWEAMQTHWLFKGFSREDLIKLLEAAELPAAEREQLLRPECLHVVPAGLDMTPPREIVASLSPQATKTLMEVLHRFPENAEPFMAFDAPTIEKSLSECGASSQAMAQFKKMSSISGDHLFLASLPCLMTELPNYEDRCRIARAITRENTLLLKIHVTPETDIKALTEYYGKGCWNADVKARFESLSQIPGGVWANISLLLPPRPAGHLYAFPQPQSPANGPAVVQDCFWTALNFLQNKSDPGFPYPEHFNAMLKSDYHQVLTDPRYGDVVLLVETDGRIIHGAVFIADDVVYTKNGPTQFHPWILTTTDDLLREYSVLTSPGQQLMIKYVRNKNF